MLVYTNSAALTAAPTTAPVSDVLRQLIADRVHDWAATELLDLTYLVIIEAGRHRADAAKKPIGYTPLTNRLDGKRFKDPVFVPQFDWLERHTECWELVQTVANDGAAMVILIEDREGVDPQLLALCREYGQ